MLVTLRCWLPKKNIKTHDDWVLNCVLRRSEISCFQGSWHKLFEHVSLGSHPFATLVQTQSFILFSQPLRCFFQFSTKSFQHLYPSLYVGRSLQESPPPQLSVVFSYPSAMTSVTQLLRLFVVQVLTPHPSGACGGPQCLTTLNC